MHTGLSAAGSKTSTKSANSVSMVTFYYLDDLKNYDFCLHAACPTSRNLILTEWKNEQGQKKKFRFKELICHKWKDLGGLLDIPLPTLTGWERKYREDPNDSINAVLGHWMENPPDYYPITWEGLNRLLNDAELSQVVEDLKQVLNNRL